MIEERLNPRCSTLPLCLQHRSQVSTYSYGSQQYFSTSWSSNAEDISRNSRPSTTPLLWPSWSEAWSQILTRSGSQSLGAGSITSMWCAVRICSANRQATWGMRNVEMTGVILMCIHATDCYEYSCLRCVYRRTSKLESISLFLLLISHITLRFGSGLFYVTSDTWCLK